MNSFTGMDLPGTVGTPGKFNPHVSVTMSRRSSGASGMTNGLAGPTSGQSGVHTARICGTEAGGSILPTPRRVCQSSVQIPCLTGVGEWCQRPNWSGER